MILSSTIRTRDGLMYSLRSTIRHTRLSRLRDIGAYGAFVEFSPIRILVPQENFTRGRVASIAHEISEETGCRLFTSFVKVDGVDYWVIQEDTSHDRQTGS